MKHYITAFAIVLLGFSASAQKQTNLGLIPTPQRVEMVSDHSDHQATARIGAKLIEKQVDRLPVEANEDQAYQLVVEAQRITLRYTADAGHQNGLLTLRQLHTLYGDAIPCCTITDWPAYRLRGWMDDISRGPVTHQDYRQRQWDTLHALKYNFCNYYTEHTLYQQDFPDLAPAYAYTKRFPDEFINLQLFAHAEKTLRVPFYEHLKDSRENFNPDNPLVYDFLSSRIAEAYRQIPYSPFFIIDCDETEQLGTGRAKQLVQQKGQEQVYVDFINRCYHMVREVGDCRVVMWGDIVAKNPVMMRQLPDDMTYIMWAYEPLDSYDHLIKPFKDNGTPFWVAPSLAHSGNMIPSPQHYMKNIANLARDGWEAGAEALMNTCWDDNGEALFDNCWHGLYWSAEMAWNPIRTDDPEELRLREEQFNKNFERLFFGDNGTSMVNTLYEVGALEADPMVGDWYTSSALMEPLLNFNPHNVGPEMRAHAANVTKKTGAIYIDSAANPHAHYAIKRIELTALKSTLRDDIYSYLNGDLTAQVRLHADNYLQELFNLKREYLRLWDQENGEYERYIVCNRYNALAREVLDMDRHVFMEVLPPNYQNTPRTPIVKLRTLFNDRPIYYTLDGSEPDSTSTRYTCSFPLERSATIKAITYNEYGEGVVSEQYMLSHLGMGAKITLNTPFATYKAIYSGGGDDALIDGQLGSRDTYADGHWQGYWGDSIDAVIDLGRSTSIHEVTMRFMQYTVNWILAPTEIKVYTSADGLTWTLANSKHFFMDPREASMRLRNYTVGLATQDNPLYTRYLRVVVPNPGSLPAWHSAPGQPSYLFTDEIVIH